VDAPASVIGHSIGLASSTAATIGLGMNSILASGAQGQYDKLQAMDWRDNTKDKQ